MSKVTYINPPTICDLCKKEIGDCFYDTKTIYGIFANVCSECYLLNGSGVYTKWMREGESAVFIKAGNPNHKENIR